MKSPRAEDVRKGISSLWDTLQCPICMDLMTTPVSTKCDHQFCKFCMQKLLDGTKQKEAKCPVCKTKITKRSLQESPGFQKLITGLQNMIEAYENDTRTNYFTGMSLQRGQQSMTEAEGSTVLSGDTSVDHHDTRDTEQHGLPGSHSSTVEAMNGFASLMDLEDSNCVFVINEGLDTSFSEISGEKMHIQPTIEPVMEQEMSEVLEKATSRPRTRGKKRLALLKNLSSRISLVPDDDQQQQAPKDDAEKATEHPEKIQHKQKKSVEKVSQWLLQVPLTENLESEVNHDVASDPEHPPASPAGSCSSASTTIIRQAKPREVNKKTEHIKSLEYQVFGVVYSRRGKRSFSPPQHPVEPFSHDPSLVDGEHNPMADIGESSEPIPDDYTPKSNSADDGAKGVVEIQPHMTNEQSSDTGKKELRALDRNADVNEIRKDRERSEKPWPQEEREASSLVINTVVLQLDNVMQDVDTDLQKQTTEKQETVAKTRPGRRKGKNAKLQNRKSVRGRKQLVLVSALEGEAISKIPKSRRECGEVQVQIETYPSSEEVSATVARTPRSRRPQHIAEEVQESSAGKRLNKRAISTRGPTPKVPGPDNHNMAKLSEEARTIISDAVNQMVVNVTKSNGCICGEDIGGIEKIESVEGSMTNFSVTEDMTPINGSIVEVPNTISPCEASAACFVPTATTRSPTAAALPSPAPESIGPADQKRALIEDSASQIECAEMEVGEDRSDSEVDTEQLMKSFKAAKRKSFHLGSPKGKRSIVSLDKRSLNSKMEDNCNSGTERPTNQILNAAEELATVRSKKPPEIERSSCGDLVASSNSPSRHRSLSGVTSRRGLRRRLVQSEKVLKLDSTILINSQDSAVGCVSGNTVYSALSPNKVAKSQTQSLHCSVAPDTSDSVLLFSALEVSEDGPPNTRICMSSDTLSVNRQGNTDNSVELVVNTNGSTTPDGLVPPVVESADKVPASGGRLSASSPIKKSTTRKRMVQWSSSESSEEELPSLAQIFKSRRRPPAVQCNRLEGQAETPKVPGRVSESEEPSILAGPVTIQPVCAPSPDFVESSQTSVDLFDTPTECDIAAIDTGISMDSSQFSSDLLVTQQKLAMQQELLRLGNLMALVTEVLQEKEDGTTSELPADGLSTGHALPMSCDQEVRQTASDPASIKGRNSTMLHGSVANPVETTPLCQLKHGNTAETVPQSSMATRHSARLSGDPRTPSSPGSKDKSTKVKTKPPPAALETRETVTGNGVMRRPSSCDPVNAAMRKPASVLVSSGLGSHEQVMVKKFAKRIGACVVPQVTPEVTHVIMCTDEDLVCERTLKYFLGIAGRKWVVSFLWISECCKQGELLDESVFEVRGDVVNGANHQGPLRARSTGDQDLLMKGYKICFQGSFTDMATDQMEWMVELCGAVVVKDLLQFDSKKHSHQLLIVQPGTETSLTRPGAVSRRATVVTRAWLLDSVATYTLQNQGNYRA